VLREFITIGASIDVTRGLPVVEVNFLGYDEQSHRRGPSSLFAHWSLKGIDDAIKRIWTAAHRSQHRRYDVWIYSDHGQEHAIPYEYEQGRTLSEAVAEVFGKMHVERQEKKKKPRVRPQAPRSTWLGQNWLSRRLIGEPPDDPQAMPELLKVADMGPIAHLYPVERIAAKDLDRVANELIQKAAIPIVMAAKEHGKAVAWTAEGRFELPDQVAEVFGADHPFINELGPDLVRLCHHPNAGQFILSGWRRGERPLTFPIENGAHAGPGTEETRAFALLPADAPIPRNGRRYLRPGELREAALHQLGRMPLPENARPVRKLARRNTVRVMTYNVHSCVGMDGMLSPSRIARVIAQCRPDIVALQELDVGRSRTGAIDQAQAIAEELKMEFHFHPALRLEEELYGDAILSRWPMRLVRAGGLPGLANRFDLEPRGALWVAVEIEGQEIQFLNTHLGLVSQERLAQAEALLGPDWLGHPDCREPVILCGDFNAIPASRAYQRLRHRLRDAQLALNGHRPKRTFFSRYPVNRIDHIFVSQQLQVLGIDVPRTDLIRVASDHLPLVADLQIVRQVATRLTPLVENAHA
jgi:endonuclease/exonuclease/phosphatase family metal-dependent hydrolase